MKKNKIKEKNGYNIFIIHAHWNNRGDEIAIRAMIDSLRTKININKINIMIMSENPANFPYKDIKIIKQFPTCAYSFENFFWTLFTVITLGRIGITKNAKDFLDAVNDSDFIIHAPGGINIGPYGCENIYLSRILVSLLLSKPVFIYPCSMGPFEGFIKNIIRKSILKRTKALIVREQISSKYLENQLGLKPFVTADSAFQYEIPSNYLNKYPDSNQIVNNLEKFKTVGIVIDDMSWHYMHSKKDLNKKLKYLFKNISEYLISKGYKILLIPHLFGSESFAKHEISLLKYIQKHDENNITILDNYFDAYAEEIIISKLFSVISMRYHPNLLAAKNHIPFIPISYEHKIDGFLKEICFEETKIMLEDINEPIIIEKFEYIEKEYSNIKNRFKKRIPYLKNQSKRSNDIITEKLTIKK